MAPLRIHSSPLRTAVVRIPARSDPVPGSVIATAVSRLPSAKPGNQRSRCSSFAQFKRSAHQRGHEGPSHGQEHPRRHRLRVSGCHAGSRGSTAVRPIPTVVRRGRAYTDRPFGAHSRIGDCAGHTRWQALWCLKGQRPPSRLQSLTNLLLHSRQSVGSPTGHLTPELLSPRSGQTPTRSWITAVIHERLPSPCCLRLFDTARQLDEGHA